ncbi:MAG: DUF2318 domain-containing protein [Synergistaceae bacterium]|nr:DUF2318 domain-containing protein [Synergistaceae bacterium]
MMFSFSHSFETQKIKKTAFIFSILGIAAGCVLFSLRVYDPKGMNIFLIALNRKLAVTIAVISLSSLVLMLVAWVINKKIFKLASLFLLGILVLVVFSYLLPPVLQYTREFIYFGESGISTNAMLRALGFTLGIIVFVLLTLSSYEVHQSLRNTNERYLFLSISILILVFEYGATAITALQRLRILKTSDAIFNISVFDVMIWRGANPNAFLYAQLVLALIMLCFVIKTHLKPTGEFTNRALLRKEKARLRDCRRWSWSLCVFGVIAVFIVVILHYYDTKPPAEVQPEPYEITDGIISIELEKVSDGHLHKFSYVTPNKFDVRFLVVKKPAGTAYGVGLDACDICGIAGYYERGNDEVVCKRCDVVMNKNTIGFKGGCNPVPFEYEIKNGKIFIDVKELEKHETRFR